MVKRTSPLNSIAISLVAACALMACGSVGLARELSRNGAGAGEEEGDEDFL